MSGEWPTRKLGAVLQIINGYAFDSKHFDATNGMPLIRIRDLKSGTHTETRFAGAYDKKYIVKAGDLLIGMDGEFGCYEWGGEPGLLNQRVCKLQSFATSLAPRFLFYGVNSYLKDIENETGYTTVKHLSSKQILDIEFPIPPLPEQRRLIKLLDQAFLDIAIAKANAERNLQNARDLFESRLNEIFTKRGLGWVEKRLDQIGTTQTGSTPSTSDKENYGNFIPFIKPADFNEDGSLNYGNAGLTEKGLLKARKVRAGSVLMVCIGATIGKCGYCDRDVTTNQQVNSLTPFKGTFYKLVYYQMRTRDFQRRMLLSSAQATLPIINKSKWEALTILLPQKTGEQSRIVMELAGLDKEAARLKSTYQKKLHALEALKKSLLNKAFRGEL